MKHRVARAILIWSALMAAMTGTLIAQNLLTNADILKLQQAGLSDEVIINSIETKPASFDLSTDAVIELKGSGVSDAVIAAMQRKTSGAPDSADEGSKTTIPDATELVVELVDPITSATARVDDPVKFVVVEDIVIDGHVVVPQGAKVRGRVLLAKPRRSFGRQGKLDFSIDWVEAVDDQRIRLRYTREEKGKAKYAKMGVVAFFAGPFSVFVKGRDVEMPAGKEFTLYIDGEKEVAVQ